MSSSWNRKEMVCYNNCYKGEEKVVATIVVEGRKKFVASSIVEERNMNSSWVQGVELGDN